jgi:hypothetical protein
MTPPHPQSQPLQCREPGLAFGAYGESNQQRGAGVIERDRIRPKLVRSSVRREVCLLSEEFRCRPQPLA